MRLGIDFGTTNSAAAVYDGHALHSIRIMTPAESQILPSLIYVDRQHQTKLGLQAATEYAHRETGRAVRWRTRRMGQLQYWVASDGGSPILVTEDIVLPYDDAAVGRLLQSVKTGLRNERYGGTQIFDRYYTLDELITLVLAHLKNAAETQLGQPCGEVVIGRPVKFSEHEWVSNRAEEIIFKAARAAGFHDISFQAEPIGALYMYHLNAPHRQQVLVFDFGGGTLDLTIAEVGAGAAPRVLASRGVLVGGDDLDRRIMLSLLPHFGDDPERDRRLPPEFVDLLSNWQSMPELSRPHHEDTIRSLRHRSRRPEAIDALRTLVSKNLGFSLFTEIERTKRELSTNLSSTLRFHRDNIRIIERITRSQFESMIKPEVRQVRAGLNDVMAQAGVTPDQINVVLRTGGSSLVPAFINLLADYFGEDKLHAMDPLVSVVGGLGIVAHEDTGLRGAYTARYLADPAQAIRSPRTSGSLPYAPDRLRVTTRVYVDHETTIRRLPVELAHLPFLRAAYADRENTAPDFLRFTLPAPARVYIAYSSRVLQRPDWLKPFSQLPDMTLEIEDEWYGIRQLQLYSRDYPAGEVVLGGSAAAGMKGTIDSTYLTAVALQG